MRQRGRTIIFTLWAEHRGNLIKCNETVFYCPWSGMNQYLEKFLRTNNTYNTKVWTPLDLWSWIMCILCFIDPNSKQYSVVSRLHCFIWHPDVLLFSPRTFILKLQGTLVFKGSLSIQRRLTRDGITSTSWLMSESGFARAFCGPFRTEPQGYPLKVHNETKVCLYNTVFEYFCDVRI